MLLHFNYSYLLTNDLCKSAVIISMLLISTWCIRPSQRSIQVKRNRVNVRTSNGVVKATTTDVSACLWIKSWAYAGHQTNNSMTG